MTVSENKVGGYSGSNSPFVLNLYMFRKSDVVSVLDPIRFPLPDGRPFQMPVGGLRLKTGAKVHRFKFPPQTCTFEQTTTRSDSGVVYLPAIEFPMPGTRIEVEDWMYQNREQQFVAIIETPNGNSWIVGNEERGLRPAAVITVGAVNQHFFSFSAALNTPLFFLTLGTGVNLAEIFPPTDFSIDFSLDFNA